MSETGKSIKIFCLLIFAVFLLNCHNSAAQEHILFDFESPSELDRLYWTCHTMYSLSDQHPTHGSKSLKLELYPFDKPDYPGLDPILSINNWNVYRKFCFDIYNPEDNKVQISLRIDDRKDYPDYADRYNKIILLDPGINRLCIPLDKMVTSGTNRNLNLKKIYRVLIFKANPEKKIVLYVDYMRLVR